MGAIDRNVDLWDGGIVPYEIDPDLARVDLIYQAIAWFEANTHLRFVRRLMQHHYVSFVRETSANSHVDALGRGSPRKVHNSQSDLHSLVHEIGHALGMPHEQQRSDRDRYVIIHWDRIRDPDQFEIKDTTHSTVYDYNSMMHYAGAPNGEVQIEPLDSTFPAAQVGALTTPTDTDISFLRTVYPAAGVIRRSAGLPDDSVCTAVSVAGVERSPEGFSQIYTTAVNASGKLTLGKWRIDEKGEVRRSKLMTLKQGNLSYVALARVGSFLVAVMRRQSGGLLLVSWDLDLQLMHDSGTLAGEATDTKILVLTDHAFVTACIDGSGALLLITWNVDTQGRFTRLHDSGSGGTRVASTSICLVRSLPDRFVIATAVQLPGGRVQAIVWNVMRDGFTLGRRSDSGSHIGKGDQVCCAAANDQLVVACRTERTTELLLIALRVSRTGTTIIRGTSPSLDGRAGPVGTLDIVSRPYGVITASQRADGTLVLIKWYVLDDHVVKRRGDSGDQAGEISAAAICVAPTTPAAAICTATLDAQSRLFLITWDDQNGPGELVR